MIVLLSSETQKRAEDVAGVFRYLSGSTRRPALFKQGKIAVSVGIGNGVCFYRTDGMIFEAQFDVNAHGELSWSRNDLNCDSLRALVDEFYALAKTTNDASFIHWCSLASG